MSDVLEPIECADCGQQFTDRQRWGNTLPPHDCPPLADWELELLYPCRCGHDGTDHGISFGCIQCDCRTYEADRSPALPARATQHSEETTK